jgi:FkbM family methyltransferase
MTSAESDPVQTIDDAAARAENIAAVRAEKLAVAAELFGAPPERVREWLLLRAISGLPRKAYERYALPRLEVAACDRVGDNLVRIALENGRVFFGHRSEQADYVMHHMLRRIIPNTVSGDAYKLAIDIHSRYVEGALPWYFGTEGTYVEGGCFTGLKAIKWHDALPAGSRILAVEIGGSNVDIMRMNVESNGLDGAVVPVHAGLWRETGEGTQHHSFTTKRFLEQTDRWKDQFDYEEKVRLLTIDDLLDEHEVEVAEYVNIQVNGAEIQVLEGFRDLGRAKVVDVAAYYGKDGVRNADVVREMLVARGCRLLHESAAGRLAFATPRHVDEVIARRP